MSEKTRSVNLSKVRFLVADGSELYCQLFRSLLFGFGAKTVHEAASVSHADRIISSHEIDFLIVAYELPPNDGLSFVRSIRLSKEHPLRNVPIIFTMGHARRVTVADARDAGVNFVVSKPIAPIVLYDRLAWLARHPRPFWESDTYFGPDRRFREPRMPGAPRRRPQDLEPT